MSCPEVSAVEIKITCKLCRTLHLLKVNPSDLDRWNRRQGLVQEIFPYLSPGERELLVSQICGDCFDSICGEED